MFKKTGILLTNQEFARCISAILQANEDGDIGLNAAMTSCQLR